MPAHPLIALLTDFGTRDAYVGVMKGVMKSICPDASLIDITHDIPPQDVRAAAFTLRNNYRFFPEGTVFLVVVDPGVGTTRRAIVWQSQDGYSFIAPDNGVLSYIFPETEQANSSSVWEITESPLENITSATFHGRDIFAPAAAITACDQLDSPAAQQILKPIAFDALVELPIPTQKIADNELSGEVLYTDHFGNIVTSIGHFTWQAAGNLTFNASFEGNAPQMTVPSASQIIIGDTTLPQIRRTYGEVEIGDLLALIGSSGYLEVSVNGGNAAKRLNVNVGDAVTVRITEDD